MLPADVITFSKMTKSKLKSSFISKEIHDASQKHAICLPFLIPNSGFKRTKTIANIN